MLKDLLISCFKCITDQFLCPVVSCDVDVDDSRLDEVHAVGVGALLDDDTSVVELLGRQRVGQVHPLVRLQKRNFYGKSDQMAVSR